MDVTNSEDINSARQDAEQKAGGPAKGTDIRKRTLEDERRGQGKPGCTKPVTTTEAMENLTPKQMDDINIIRVAADELRFCIMSRVISPDSRTDIGIGIDQIQDAAANAIAGAALYGGTSESPAE